MMVSFADLKANLKKDFSGLKCVRVAVASDSAMQHFTVALRASGYEAGLDLIIHDTGYDQIERSIFDPSSDLYQFDPQCIIVFHWVEKLFERFQRAPPAERSGFADAHLAGVRSLIEAAGRNSQSRIFYVNFPEFSDGVYGNYSSKLTSSWLFQIRKINFGLMALAREFPNLFINDLAALATRHGALAMLDPKQAISANMAFALDFLPIFATNTARIIAAIEGRTRKCLVLDLDNTLWGGVIGDDGLENIEIGGLGIGSAFTRVQLWAKQLKQRGIVLAVCSKNTESVALEPFQKHPDMVLRQEDIAVFVANWENKVDNIRHIQSVLEIGLDAMVFVDDSPVERELVRNALPEVLVPELPEDPAEFAETLQRLELFETASITEEDADRTLQYQQEARRRELTTTFQGADDFLKSLEMVGTVEAFTPFNAPRVAQLTQRSNQFNLRTVRYTEQDIRRIASSPEHRGFAFSLADKFGSYGLICVVILRFQEEEFFIDTWLMSCRVLKRGMEQFVLNRLVDAGREAGFTALVGEYLPTGKNALVKDHYASLGFSAFLRNGAELWRLKFADFVPRPNHIKNS